MPQSQNMRELVAKMKLIPNKSIIYGKSGVFLDDSIVRGTQLKDNVHDLHGDAVIKTWDNVMDNLNFVDKVLWPYGVNPFRNDNKIDIKVL